MSIFYNQIDVKGICRNRHGKEKPAKTPVQIFCLHAQETQKSAQLN